MSSIDTSEHAPLTSPDPASRATQRATRLAFLYAGVAMSAWAPLVPIAQARLSLDPGTLGLLLLCLGAGSIVAMPVSGALAARHGVRIVLLIGGAVGCAMLPLLATASSLPVLAAALLAFGAGIGAVDCTINIQAVIVERASGRTMMSGFHGLFSVGGIVGAAGVSALLGLGASPLVATLVVVAALVAMLVVAGPDLLTSTGPREAHAFMLPRGIVLFIGVLCFVVFLAEGAMLDWSGVFLSTIHAVDAARAGLGYAVFAAFMTAGRLSGDRIVQRLGGVRIVIVGGTLAAIGLLLVTFAPTWLVALAGFGLIGAGCSNIVPVLYSGVGRQTVMPESSAVPAITTIGYSGILAGPAVIGFIAHGVGLPNALRMLAVALVGVALCGPVLVAVMPRRRG
jgi:predicted MFS family arabinose efflux permease